MSSGKRAFTPRQRTAAISFYDPKTHPPHYSDIIAVYPDLSRRSRGCQLIPNYDSQPFPYCALICTLLSLKFLCFPTWLHIDFLSAAVSDNPNSDPLDREPQILTSNSPEATAFTIRDAAPAASPPVVYTERSHIFKSITKIERVLSPGINTAEAECCATAALLLEKWLAIVTFKILYVLRAR